ncbi:MAG: hypothetical protein N3B10_09210 [Armatimonadetes bacterium]|nr:hypothetical protein [Armatimonadota bacterium]
MQHLVEGIGLLAEGQRHLQTTVAQLVEWQQQTQGTVAQLQGTVAQLVEGQQRLQLAVTQLAEENRRLAEGQERLQETVAQLTEENRRLADGQQRLQETVAQLAEENRRLADENRRLAEGQMSLQEAVAKLVEENRKMSVVLKEVNKKVGRLDEQWGMTIESVAQLVLPRYLESEYGIKLKGRLGYQLRPMFFKLNGEWEQVDLYGEGKKGEEEICIVCECKAKIYGRDVLTFAKKLDRLWLHLRKRPIAVMFGYSIHPSAEEEANSRKIILVNPLVR